jgi:hypothetical protein
VPCDIQTISKETGMDYFWVFGSENYYCSISMYNWISPQMQMVVIVSSFKIRLCLMKLFVIQSFMKEVELAIFLKPGLFSIPGTTKLWSL